MGISVIMPIYLRHVYQDSYSVTPIPHDITVPRLTVTTWVTMNPALDFLEDNTTVQVDSIVYPFSLGLRSLSVMTN